MQSTTPLLGVVLGSSFEESAEIRHSALYTISATYGAHPKAIQVFWK